EISDNTVDGFGKVVRGHIGSHSHSNTRSTVQQHIGKHARHHRRLLQRIIEVALPVYRILVEVSEHLFRNAFHADLGLSNSRRTVPVKGAKVTLSVYQRISQGKVLHHSYN